MNTFPEEIPLKGPADSCSHMCLLTAIQLDLCGSSLVRVLPIIKLTSKKRFLRISISVYRFSLSFWYYISRRPRPHAYRIRHLATKQVMHKFILRINTSNIVLIRFSLLSLESIAGKKHRPGC